MPARALLLVLLGWAGVVMLWPAAPDAMLVDDAWYYLRTARNVVDGFGVSFDREEAFNGFHPLWMVVLVPIAALTSDPDLLARVVLLLQVMLAGVGVLAWSRALSLDDRGLLAGALLLLNPWAMKVLACGQESGLAFVLLAMTALAAERGGWRLGLAAGLAVLARTDLVPVVAAFVAYSEWQRTPRAGRALALTTIVALAVVLPWLVWSSVTQGTVVQVSAAVKAELAGHARWTSLAQGIAAGALVGFGLGSFLRPRSPVAWLVTVFAVLEVGRLVGLRATNGVSIWYLFALMPAALAVGARALDHARLRAFAHVAFVAGAMGAWFVRVDPASYAVAAASREMGQWLQEHTPLNARIAGWDIGAAAAWSNRSFRNLEGLASSWRFKREVLDAKALGPFLHGDQVDVIAQYVPSGALARSVTALQLDPALWRVRWSRDVEMRSITSRSTPWRFTFVVLDRGADGPTVAEFAAQR